LRLTPPSPRSPDMPAYRTLMQRLSSSLHSSILLRSGSAARPPPRAQNSCAADEPRHTARPKPTAKAATISDTPLRSGGSHGNAEAEHASSSPSPSNAGAEDADAAPRSTQTRGTKTFPSARTVRKGRALMKKKAPINRVSLCMDYVKPLHACLGRSEATRVCAPLAASLKTCVLANTNVSQGCCWEVGEYGICMCMCMCTRMYICMYVCVCARACVRE
jgi:hypothetical protein